MGRFVNPGNSAFIVALNSEIYVDKTGLLEYTNKVMNTNAKFICNSRPRRFGKSITTEMLAAYYGKNCDSKDMFSRLTIGKSETFKKYLNQYDVILFDVQWCMMDAGSPEETVAYINEHLVQELKNVYQDVELENVKTACGAMSAINAEKGVRFVVIIDEWDVLIRDESAKEDVQKEYIDFLRGMFKGVEPTKYIQLAYLTGILPIKKEKAQSAVNNLDEFTMLQADELAQYIGFTEDEVKKLCEKYNRDFDKVKKWYDGYLLNGYQVYNPKAVVSVMTKGRFRSYWSETGSYEVVVPLICMNYDGLKNAIIEMLSGSEVEVNTATFKNDPAKIQNRDDVITYLIHLGYLGYNEDNDTAFVPNEEIRQELITAVKSSNWDELIAFQQESRNLLMETLAMNEKQVAFEIDKIHSEYTSTIQYNNENSLSSTITIAYLGAMQYYFKPVRELPTGLGFADFVFIPKPEYKSAYPALVVELKWNKDTETAIEQIKNRRYPESVLNYTGDILLVGINYDKKSKKHQCIIEKYRKN